MSRYYLHRDKLGFWPSLLIIGLVVACGYLLIWGSPFVDNRTASAAPTTTSPPMAVPSEKPLACTPGKWITQLGSMKPVDDWQSNARLVSGGLRKVRETAEKHDVNLSINYTRTDGRQCSIVPSGYHLLWSGPYVNAEAAMRTCNQLGWKKRSDRRYCFGRTIDKNYTGKEFIGPSGQRW